MANLLPSNAPGARACVAKPTCIGIFGVTVTLWWRVIFTYPGIRGEIDMVGYDGPVLAFVEVKTRTILESAISSPDLLRIPEDAVNWERRRNLSRMARQFLRARHIESGECRFDVLANRNAARCKTLRASPQRRVQRPPELTHHRDCTLVRKSQLHADSTRSSSASS